MFDFSLFYWFAMSDSGQLFSEVNGVFGCCNISGDY